MMSWEPRGTLAQAPQPLPDEAQDRAGSMAISPAALAGSCPAHPQVIQVPRETTG